MPLELVLASSEKAAFVIESATAYRTDVEFVTADFEEDARHDSRFRVRHAGVVDTHRARAEVVPHRLPPDRHIGNFLGHSQRTTRSTPQCSCSARKMRNSRFPRPPHPRFAVTMQFDAELLHRVSLTVRPGRS
jgi:hypothetical protein